MRVRSFRTARAVDQVLFWILIWAACSVPARAGERVASGLRVLYDFRQPDGTIVRDRAGTAEPLDLTISSPEAVQWDGNVLEVTAHTRIGSQVPATTIIDAVQRSGAISVEAWIVPARDNQTGPARIVTLSKDSGQRNFTVGQDGNRFDVRFRTTETSANGQPSLATADGTVRPELTHLVYTRDSRGNARIYLNSEQAAEAAVPGSISNWDPSFHLGLANEFSDDRPWLGSFRLVAVYARALSAEEVARNFSAGPDAPSAPAAAEQDTAVQANTRLFHEEIAPLLSRHCLECHDSANRKGKLDLSRKEFALAGGRGGAVVLPGNANESPLYDLVASEEMPQDRAPLSQHEKDLLRRWIDAGAHWPLAELDPLAHKRDRRADGNWVRRLTVTEYINTVRAVIGVDIEREAREFLPADVRADGFNNTAYNLAADFQHVDAYSRLAEIAVSRMDVLAFAQNYQTNLVFDDEPMAKLIEGMGKRLLRGPLDPQETISYRGISTGVAAASGSLEEAVGLIIQAMLQSPRFLYQIETQRGDGTSWPLTPHELASRMSYIVWGAPPDDDLVRAADAGELSNPDHVRAQVERMLGDPRAIGRSEEFLANWLDLERLDRLQPAPALYPDWDPALAADMREETLAFFRDLAWEQKRPLHELFNARFTYLTPRLATHYGLPAKGDFARYDLSDTPARGGLLTHGSMLTIGGDEASTVARGLFLLHDILRSGVNDPPPGVDTTPVPSKPGQSQRQIAEERIANQSCAGCHGKFEPAAFGLMKFDGLGAFREADHHGNPLPDDGTIHFPGDPESTPFKNSTEMMDLLAASDRVRETITWKVTQFALGRPLTGSDQPALEAIHSESVTNGGTYASLIQALVTSELVQTITTERE